MENEFLHTGVVIVAGGSGRRMGGPLPKQFLLLEGLPVLAHTIRNFARALRGASVVVVLPAEWIDFWRDYAARFEVPRHKVVSGGAERFDSVRNGIEALPMDTEWIAVQDGVRPLGSVELIRRTVRTAQQSGSAVPVVAATDSYRRVTATGESEAVDRAPLRQVQTPQVFRAGDLRFAYGQPSDPAFTDDATVVERTGVRITLCEGERTNLKITTREDLVWAAAILEDRRLREEERRRSELMREASGDRDAEVRGAVGTADVPGQAAEKVVGNVRSDDSAASVAVPAGAGNPAAKNTGTDTGANEKKESDDATL